MSKETAASRFILSPSEVKSVELYQALLQGIRGYEELGRRLVSHAEQAHAIREFDALKEAAQMLLNLPIKNYQAIGTYFLAIATHRKASGDWDAATRLFELAVETAPDAYKVKSLLSLGGQSFRRRDFSTALRYFGETIRHGRLSAASLQATRGISMLKSLEGDHAPAVKDLENILPTLKNAPAHIHFDILNSYAVELGEVGRKDEARNIMRAVLASPFAFAYPEWRQTAEDLKPARSSFVALGSLARSNVTTLPEPKPTHEPAQQPATEPKPARVLNFARWKKKLAKKAREKQADHFFDDMSLEDMGLKLFELLAENQPDWDQMRTILAFVINLFSGPARSPDKPSA